MSEEFFEKYNELNSEPQSESPDTEPEAENNRNSVSDSEQEAMTEPAQPEQYSQPEQPAYQNPYTYHYARPVQPDVPPVYGRGAGAPNAQPVYGVPSGVPSGASSATTTGAANGSTVPAQPNTANTYVDADGYYHRSFTENRPMNAAPHPQTAYTPQPPRRVKTEKGSISKGAIAAVLILCVLLSGLAGFGGSMLANSVSGSRASSDSYDTVSSELVIHKVSVENSSETTGSLVDKDTDEITREVADSVVEITTEVVQTSSFYGQYISTGAGSGVIISSDGYIITNNHVIEGASQITVTLRNGESYEAKLIGTDSDVDVALIKIDASGLTTAIFGDSETIEVGDKSVIIGNPLGTLGGSVTEGIVSALDRSIVIDGKTMHLMQTDAAINPGNSGGGMFNGQGELVGLVVAKSGASEIDNIGFVIPINNVLNILGDLKQYGYVRGKADTGMSYVDITNQMYAWYYYGSSSTGVYISSVERGSNAASAGFSAGDRVISVDGKKISSASDISSIISEHSAGDTITFELERGGRTGSIDLTLEEYVPSNNSSAFSMY